MTAEAKPTCFIAMPITTHENEASAYGDTDHWDHVMHHLFVPAVEQAGYIPVLPAAEGSTMIHGRIIRQLIEADMVLCDVSRHNPNVLFELGVRSAMNRPVTLVKDEHMSIPFDLGVLNIKPYSSALRGWELPSQIDDLSRHIQTTATHSDEKNPLWEHFGVAIAAARPSDDGSPTDAKLALILEQLQMFTTTAVAPSRQQRSSDAELERPNSRSRFDEHTKRISDIAFRIDGARSIGFSGDPYGYRVALDVNTKRSEGDTQNERTSHLVKSLVEAGYVVSVTDSDQDHIKLSIEWSPFLTE